MRRQNSWTDPTIIGEHRRTLWFHRPEINSISGNVVIRPFPSHASKFPPRLTTWLASPGLIRTLPLHPIERNWLRHQLSLLRTTDCDLRRLDGRAIDGPVLQSKNKRFGFGWSV